MKIISSADELEMFTRSSLFADFTNEIELRIEETTVMLDDFDGTYTGRQYDMFRGRKRNLLEMKHLFHDLATNKASDQELEEGQSEEGEDDV